MQADTRYVCKIISAELAESTKKGTDALDVEVEITEGDCTGERAVAALWLTENTVGQVKRTLRDLGVPSDALSGEEFWRAPNKFLDGAAASIVTEGDEFGNVRVKYLNGPSASRNRPSKDPRAAAKRAAGLFASSKNKELPLTGAAAPADDDVPF